MAISMFYLFILEGLGTTELLVILVVALLVFGPRRLPELGRKLGKTLGEFRRASEDFKHTWETEVNMEGATGTEEHAPEVPRRELLEQTSIPVQSSSTTPEDKAEATTSQQSVKLNQVAAAAMPTATAVAATPNNFTLNASDDVLHTNNYARIDALGAEANVPVANSDTEDVSAVNTTDATPIKTEATTAHGETVVRSARTTASDRIAPRSV